MGVVMADGSAYGALTYPRLAAAASLLWDCRHELEATRSMLPDRPSAGSNLPERLAVLQGLLEAVATDVLLAMPHEEWMAMKARLDKEATRPI